VGRGARDDVKMCRKGLHPLEGANVGVQASTGRPFCRACKAAYKRARRAKAGKCPKGLHSFANPDNWYTTATGQKRCRPCFFKAKQAKIDTAEAAAAAATAAAAEAARVPPRQRLRTLSPRGGGYGTETDARYRLALHVRGRT